MIHSNRITVGTAATLLVPPSTHPQKVSLLNAGTAIVRVGGEDVTTSAWGLPVIPNNPNVARTYFYADLNPGEAIYALVADGEAPVNVWYQTTG